MDFDLTSDQIAILGRVRDFCDREVIPRAPQYDLEEKFPWPLIEGLKELGLWGMIFPKRYGGQGLDMATYCLVLEELGRADPSLALTVESHNSLCANHIYLAGDEEQKRAYLPRLTAGEALGAWALTEPGAGSDAAGIISKSRLDGDHWILNGAKTFTTQGSVAGIYVIFACTGQSPGAKSISAFVAEKGTPGLEIGKKEIKMGLRASDTAQLHLVDMKLPAKNLLGRQGRGFIDAMRILDGGRVGISGISLGIARGAVELGIRWVKPRKLRFGIDGSPGLTAAQKLLADLHAETEAVRLLVLKAATLLDRGAPFSHEASMAKLLSGELAMKASTLILDLLGPAGGSMDCPAQKFFRDAKLYQIGEGAANITKAIIALDALGWKKANR